MTITQLKKRITVDWDQDPIRIEYIYLSYYMVVSVLCHVNYCRSFNAKTLFIHIKYDLTFPKWYFQASMRLFFHAVKWFHLFLSHTNNFIYYKSFVCSLFVFRYCYVSITIKQSFVNTKLNGQNPISNNPIEHKSKLNGSRYCYASL